jgi:hypothetical protein
MTTMGNNASELYNRSTTKRPNISVKSIRGLAARPAKKRLKDISKNTYIFNILWRVRIYFKAYYFRLLT